MSQPDVNAMAAEVVLLLKTALAPVLERLAKLEAQPPARDGRDGQPGRDGIMGVPGEKGLDGLNGKDGADGLGFDDLDVEFDGERTLAFTFLRQDPFTGEKRKSFPITLSHPIYQGPYQPGQAYARGDEVTAGGGRWICREATITRPGESKAWTLTVRGRK